MMFFRLLIAATGVLFLCQAVPGWAQGQQPAQQELQAEQEVNMPEERVEQTGPTPQEIEHHQWQQERAQQEREEMERLQYGK